MLAACQTTTYETASDTNLKPRDKELLAKARYAKAEIPQPYRRAIVSYHRKETPGTIVIDSDNHYLYLVQNDGKALRYGVTVGEEALAFSGIAKVGNMQEWPRWIPTADIHKRIEGLPKQVDGGPDNPLGARALYLHQGGKDTLFRIHGTNQPEYIGESISSGCIRMTNEDVDRPLQPREDRHHRRRARPQGRQLSGQSARRAAGPGRLDVLSRTRHRVSERRRASGAFFVGRASSAGLPAACGAPFGWLACRSLLRRLALGLLLRGLARRRILGPHGRQQRRDLRHRIPHIPLADAIARAPLGEIEMHVILVVPVRARTEHRREARAHRGEELLAQFARDRAVGERHELAVRKLDAAHVERIGAAMLGHARAGDAVAAAAVE